MRNILLIGQTVPKKLTHMLPEIPKAAKSRHKTKMQFLSPSMNGSFTIFIQYYPDEKVL